MLTSRLAIIVLAALGACSPSARDSSTRSELTADSIVVEHAPCFGPCPVYRMRVAASGDVRLTDLGDAAQARDTSLHVAPETLRGLVSAADSLGYFAFPETIRGDTVLCPHFPTDFPTVTTTVYRDGQGSRVADYRGCMTNAIKGVPAARLASLRAWSSRLDSIADSAHWVRPPSRH
jgi:hypothetical protein